MNQTVNTQSALRIALGMLSFRDMRLSRKFGVISAVLIIGFAALGAAYWRVTTVNTNATNDTQNITHFGELVDQINIQFLEMRRLEKDFILEKDKDLLGAHSAQLAAIEESIAEVLENPPTQEVAALVEDMSLYLGLYKGSFSEMAASMELAGLAEDKGYLGQLNSSAANINDLVSGEGATALQLSLMNMRHLERSYIVDASAETFDAIMAEKTNFDELLADSSLDSDTRLFIADDLEAYLASMEAYGESLVQLMDQRQTFSDVALEFAPLLASMKATKDSVLATTLDEAVVSQKQISMIFVAIVLLVAGVVNVAFFSLSRIITRPLQQAVGLSAAIARGELDNVVSIDSNDETGALLTGLNNMQSQLREQKVQLNAQMQEVNRRAEESARMAAEQKQMMEEQARMAAEQGRIATETGRIKQALDGVSSPVLMLDADLKVIYHNQAAHTMFREGESEIRRVLPQFSANDLIGKGVDYLYVDGNEEAAVLRNLTRAQSSDQKLGARSYRITSSPVNDTQGVRIGTVAEWQDRTTEVAIEDEVQSIVRASLRGDLSRRIDLKNKNGFFHDLSQGVNQLVSVAEKVIQDTVSVLSNLARGDLTHTMDGNFEGLFAQLKADVNSTISKLTSVVGDIQVSAQSVENVASSITETNAEVSRRTEQQAASLEETAAAIEEMTATIRQTAGNTVEANKLADEARTKAEAGGDIVGQAIAAMADINNSSKQIISIIGVIDEISFQTNLLALNAAVEAARAGDQGRGFAVVADEVRKLAAHSASAAKEIKQLIDHSDRQVTRGTELVNKSGESLASIVSSIKRVSTIISEIATASEEQADGIEQVNSSIRNIDEGTQQNAAMVEKATGAINTMSDEAQKLNEVMKFFTTEQSSLGKGMPDRSRLRAV